MLLLIASILLSLPFVQTSIAKKVTNILNKEYNTNINIDKISASFFTGAVWLKGVYIEDYKKDTLIYVKELTTSLTSVKNTLEGKLKFGKIEVEDPFFNFKTYKGEQDSNLDIFIAKLDDGQPSSGEPFLLSFSKINLKNGSFLLIDQNNEIPQILNFKAVNAQLNNFKILGPQVTSVITNMNFKSERGVIVEQFTTNFFYDKKAMRFDSLKINTKNSILKGNLIFNYDREDFKNFTDKVQLEAEFKESTVSFNELNLFYNEFGENKKINFSTKINGVLNNLTTQKLELTSETTTIQGDFNFKNLFSSDKVFAMQADIQNLSSNYYQLKELLPKLLGNTLPSSFSKFGQFTLTGQTYITEKNIDAKINLNTSLGKTISNLKLSNINNIDNASYVGTISLQDFNLGEFINDKKIGKTTLDVKVEGSGFTQEKLNTQVKGKLFDLTWNNYTYKDILISGVLKDQLFDGNLEVNDPNFKFTFQGLADLSREKNSFDFVASVTYADLYKINLMKRDKTAIFKGDMKMNITGNSIEDIAGEINFTKTSYTNHIDTYYFDDFNVISTFLEDKTRLITINSPDIINGTIKGKFIYRELGKLIENSIGSLYTNYSPHKITAAQNLDFNLKIYNKVVEVFYPQIQLGKNTTIKGNIIADEGDFKLNFNTPKIAIKDNVLNTLNLQIDNKNPIFNTYVEVENITTGVYNITNFNLINTTIKDTLFFRTEFKGGKNASDIYNLNFYHTFNEEKKSVIGLKKSDVSFKGNTWLLNQTENKKNKVIFNRQLDSIKIEDVIMTHQDEQIDLSGEFIGDHYKNLNLQFKNVALNKVTPDIEGLFLEGIIDGKFNILQQQKNYLPTSNLTISNLHINKFGLGNLTMGVVGNDDLTKYVVDAHLSNEGKTIMNILGNLAYIDNKSNLDLLVLLDNFNLEPFSPLGEDVLSNIKGYVSGNFNVKGKLTNPEFTGALNLSSAGLKVPYLNTYYNFLEPAKINLYKQTFEFDYVPLIDTHYKTQSILSGTITHSYFKNWYLDLFINTQNKRFLVLNTPPSEEELYYGTGFINGTAEIYGATDAITIKVAGATAEGTSLKIPVSDAATIGDYSFINFINKKEDNIEENTKKLQDFPGLEMEFDLDVLPNAEVEIVIDPKTGSSLKGTGAGNLLIEINTKGKFNMYGDFLTYTGDYNFKYGGLIDKRFKVKPNGTINWNGDPLDANINMQAVYSLTANPAVLLDNQSFTRRIPTNVLINIEGQLMEFDPEFDIEFPGASSILNSELQYRLDDPEKRELQALSLLAQGTFINQVSITQQAITGNLIETANSLVNQLLSNGNSKLNVGVSYEQGFKDINQGFETEDRLGVTISTQVSDKIIINGKVGVPVGGIGETVVAGDVEMQILLNEDGTLRARIFNRENEIQQFIADRQGYTQGVGLSYQVEFDTFKELLKKIFLSKEKREAQQQEKLNQNKEKDTLSTMGNGLIKIKQKGQ